MDPFTIAMIASAVLGQAKGEESRRNYKKEQGIESLKERFSPFTGEKGQTLRSPSTIDPMMQALVTGAMIGKQLKSSGDQSGNLLGNAYQQSQPGMSQNQQPMPGEADNRMFMS